jgi:carboxyl-terminal processing protease
MKPLTSLLKRAGSVLFVLTLLNLTVCPPAQSKHVARPKELYQLSWQLVRDNYYEPGFNGQNWDQWQHKFDGKLKTEQDAYRAIRLMLASLNDPYTRFLDPTAFQDENDAIDSRIVGIGINLQQIKDPPALVVTRTIEDSPADYADLKPGDEILSVNGTSVIGMAPEGAAELIRGDVGTNVRLKIRHSGAVKSVEITRAEITIHAVATKLLPNNIGYIQLSTFIANDAAREFRLALQRLAGCDGLIIDLRDDPGGLLSNALEIADMLLENGSIVRTSGRHGQHIDTSSGTPVTRQAMAILVDRDSASASEILAGALKDNGRATIIGTRTYGKGLVQEINRLPGGAAVHITVSKYFTPSGNDINKIGVIPDIEVGKKEEALKVASQYLQNKIASGRTIQTSSLAVPH